MRSYEELSRVSHENGKDKEFYYKSKVRPVSNSMGDFSQQEIVDDFDDRKRLGSIKDTPYRWICMLDLHTKSGLFGGTGVLISPRHILTAGHNLDGCNKVVVVPGINGRFKPFGSYESTTMIAHDKWKKHRDDNFDIGMIKLSKPVGNQRFNSIKGNVLGHWGHSAFGMGTRIIPFVQSNQLNKKANIAGYPSDKGFTQLWWDAGKIVNTAPAKASGAIYYTMDTCGAQSGSPVWLRSKSSGARFLIAIHSGPCLLDGSDCKELSGKLCPGSSLRKPHSSNMGVFLTAGLIKTIRSWIRSM